MFESFLKVGSSESPVKSLNHFVVCYLMFNFRSVTNLMPFHVQKYEEKNSLKKRTCKNEILIHKMVSWTNKWLIQNCQFMFFKTNLKMVGPLNFEADSLVHIPYHPCDWYIYLHENHKNQPFTYMNG